MTGISEIEKIISIFSSNRKKYCLFELQASKYQWLYLKNFENTIIALIYGDNFGSIISQILENTKIEELDCIECKLGINVIGGISYDHGELVEFGISKEEANLIIKNLSTKLLTEEFDVPNF